MCKSEFSKNGSHMAAQPVPQSPHHPLSTLGTSNPLSAPCSHSTHPSRAGLACAHVFDPYCPTLAGPHPGCIYIQKLILAARTTFYSPAVVWYPSFSVVWSSKRVLLVCMC